MATMSKFGNTVGRPQGASSHGVLQRFLTAVETFRRGAADGQAADQAYRELIGRASPTRRRSRPCSTGICGPAEAVATAFWISAGGGRLPTRPVSGGRRFPPCARLHFSHRDFLAVATMPFLPFAEA